MRCLGMMGVALFTLSTMFLGCTPRNSYGPAEAPGPQGFAPATQAPATQAPAASTPQPGQFGQSPPGGSSQFPGGEQPVPAAPPAQFQQ